MSDINGALKRVLQTRTKNVARPIAGPIVEQDFAEIEVTGGPSTGDLTGLVIKIGDKNFSSPTTAGFTAAQETTAAVAAWQAGVDAASTGPFGPGAGGFGPGKVTVVATGPTTIRISTDDGTPLNLTDEGSLDATTGLDVTDGTHIQNAMLYDETVLGAGFPNLGSDGFDILYTSKDDSSAATCVIRAEVKNLSVAEEEAQWQVWWFIPYLGWDQDQEVGTRTIVCAAGDTQDDVIAVSAPGATKIAIVLASNMAADTFFSAWGTVAG
jgi:hypothetical protein